MRKNLGIVPILVGFLFLAGCGNDQQGDSEKNINIRLVEEPDRLHPMLSVSNIATQLENHIFLPVMEFDPQTLEFLPILVDSAPEVKPYKNGKSFSFKMREDALWEDGKPITGLDYKFTVKAAVNPHSSSRAWRGFLSEIDSVWVNPNAPREFTVFIDDAFHLALETAGNFNIYPQHHYDPNNLLGNYTISDFKKDSVGGLAEEFGKWFQKPSLSRDSLLGSGPYRLTAWEPDLYLELTKRDDYTLNFPEGIPDKITYQIVPDEATAVSMLKGGQLDVISGVSPTVFSELKGELSDQFDFLTPSIMQFYYLCLNNTNPRLGDFAVRRALAHALDLKTIIEVVMKGLAEPVASPTHPAKPHYKSDLSIIEKDVSKAKALLDDSGWVDNDGDGIREKNVNGQIEKLSLDILVTQRELGRNIARILKENSREIGIEINITSMEWAQIVQKMSSRDFDIIAMASRQSPGLDDHFGLWHSESVGPDGRNISGFGTPKSDSLILAIRNELDPNKRTKLYHAFQQIIYDEQPIIFLFAPTETVISSKRWKIDPSSRRPGYFENMARPQ